MTEPIGPETPPQQAARTPTHQIDTPTQIPRISGRARRLTPAQRMAQRAPTAVFVAHGMGQQARFQTLDEVATGLLEAAGTDAPAIASTVRIGDQKLQRLELHLYDAGGREVEVHVYEGYWAPLTEGQVTLRDVTGFLLSAGLNGIRNSLGRFKRWMFGRDVDFGRKIGTTFYLVVTLLVVLSLFVMNAVIATLVGGDVVAAVGITAKTEIAVQLRDVLSTVMVGYVAVSGLLGVGIAAALALRPGTPSANFVWRAYTGILQGLFWLWVLATMAAGLGLAAERAGWRILAWLPDSWLVSGSWLVWLWVGLAAVTWLVRGMLVQYVGDVAAYVASHRLDRFNDLRAKIKQAVYDTARAVYSAADAHDEFLYGRVLVVGHSLGSVIAYDTLNALLNEDYLADPQPAVGAPPSATAHPALAVAERTGLLLTFGSPLDKVAFIFARAGATAHQRAAAASVQPLIQDYARFRTMPWVNLYARRDIISGALDFFDDPEVPAGTVNKVDSEKDPDALIPLVAHVEFWRNDAVFRVLRENL